MVAAAGSILLGRASDVWGRRPLLLGGMAVSAATSLLLPLVEGELALMTVYGLAGLGVAAFTPGALSLVGDAAAPGRPRLRVVLDRALRCDWNRTVPRGSRG